MRRPIRAAALRRTWPLAAALLVIALIASAFCFTSRGQPALASAFLLPDMMVTLPVRPITWFTDKPVVERTYIEYDGGRILADIYRPGGGGKHAAVIFSMGAPPLDLDDSRLKKLAEDVARGGLIMIVPFSDRLNAELVEPEEIDALVGIYQYAERQPYVDTARVGYIGVSVGGSLALVAAEDPRINDRVDFAVSFGGYYNGLDALTAIGAREIEYKGKTEPWNVDSHSVEVTALQLIDALPDARDRTAICKAYVDSWDWDLCETALENQDPLSPSDVAQLTPQGRIAFEFLASGGLAQGKQLVGQLPLAVREKMVAISPDRGIDRLHAELYIIHDRGDKFVPYVESRRLRDALKGKENVHYTEVSLFEHVEPRLSRGGDVIVFDGTRLYFRLYQLLLKLT